MIVVDTSALIAIVKKEAEEERFAFAIGSDEAVIGAPTLFETRLVLQSLLRVGGDRFIEDMVANPAVRIEAFSLDHYRVAAAALRTYGRGQGHPAKLNFGDCMSYAVAKLNDAPLLYKGDDFIHTDIRPAYLP